MIVHEVKIGRSKTAGRHLRGRHKTIYVSSAKTDLRYRDMLVYFRHRLEFYLEGTLDFITCDHNQSEQAQWEQTVEEKIRNSDGVIMLVSENTVLDEKAGWEIECALSNNVPIAGVDIRNKFEGKIPEKLVGKMTRYGWEWFAAFIDGL
jgi:hypothetical protein